MAHNLRWAWDHNTIELFRRWTANSGRLPGTIRVRMLGTDGTGPIAGAGPRRILHGASGAQPRESWKLTSLPSPPGICRTYGTVDGVRVAYFSAEFGTVGMRLDLRRTAWECWRAIT
ncbi:MAG: hypothetical protein WDO73_37875 [Ignavibacteriota bacterium]